MLFKVVSASLILLITLSCSQIRKRNYGPVKKDRVVEAGLSSSDLIQVPRDQHWRVYKWINYFSKKDRARFQRHLNRGAKFKAHIERQLVLAGIPQDMYYLGLLESGYVINAKSHAGAVGPWQFMRPTAREYGLRINSHLDERKAPIRSTQAAAKYLRWLFKRTGGWELTMAAYNAGPGRVSQAMSRGKSKNYWQLVRSKSLPRDTREYVAQFIAVKIIGKNLKHFGFEEVDVNPLGRVRIAKPTRLTDIAKLINVSPRKINYWNSHLIRGRTLPGKTTIWIPMTKKEFLIASSKKLEALRQKRVKRIRVAAAKSYRVHRVRRGQTLGRIAKKYSTTVRRIKSLNQIRGNKIFVGQRLLVAK